MKSDNVERKGSKLAWHCVGPLLDIEDTLSGCKPLDLQANPNTFLVVTPGGGHLGWIAGEEAPLGAPWTDPLVMEFFKTFLELQPSGRRDTPSAKQEVGKTLREVNSSGEEALELSQSWNKR